MTKNQLSADLAKFEAVFYGTETPLVIFKGPELIYEMINDTYQAIYPNRELLGKPLLEAIPELVHSPFPDILKKVYETGENFISHEGAVSLKNNLTGKTEERYFDTTFSRIDFGNGEVFRILATPKEVTDKVLARKKLEQSLNQLSEEKDLREKFVSALTHDLRTPLAIIKLSAQVLKSKINDPVAFEKNLLRILNNADRADRMIHDLLDANRLNANEGLPAFLQESPLAEIVKYVITDLEDLYGKRFTFHNHAGNIKVIWDSNAIHRIFENLASNAIKYGTPGSTITIELRSVESNVEIRIHNLGNPISADDQKLLFHPFQRTEFAKSSKQKGWGIGLSLVQGIARSHNGSVTVESSPAAGTTFIVRLPVDANNKKSS